MIVEIQFYRLVTKNDIMVVEVPAIAIKDDIVYVGNNQYPIGLEDADGSIRQIKIFDNGLLIAEYNFESI